MSKPSRKETQKKAAAKLPQHLKSPAPRPSSKPSQTDVQKQHPFLRQYGIDIALIAAGMLHAFIIAVVISPIYDEGKHIINGIAYLENKECCLSDESPFSFMHAMFLDRDRMSLPPLNKSVSPPRGVLLYPDNKDMRDWIRISSRISSIAMFGLMMVVLGLWLRETTSTGISRIGLFIAAFSPNLLAYASIASCDIHLTAISFLCLYLWMRFTRHPSFKSITAVGVSLGLTLLTKFSAILFAGALFVMFLVFAVSLVIRAEEGRLQIVRKFLLMGCMLVFVSLFILNLGYFFKGSFSSIRDLEMKSAAMTSLQEQWTGSIPLPVPAGLIKTVDYTKRNAESEARKNIIPGILFGKPYPDGNKWFYLALLALKPSSILQLFFIFGIVLWARQRGNLTDGMTLFFYPVFLVAYLSMFDVFNRGIRYLLPLFPLMIITAVHSFLWKRSKYLLFALPIVAVSTLLNFPSYLSFFNVSEWVFAKEDMLTDSNLDWGQSDHLVTEDATERNIAHVCPILQQPHPSERLGLVTEEATYPKPCTYYLSKSQKIFSPAASMFQLIKPPDKVLGGLIEVYDVTSENDFKNRFLNRWSISEPFDAARFKKEHYLPLSKSLSYKDIRTTFGHVDIGHMFPKNDLGNKCVIAKSNDVASGKLLFSAVHLMQIMSDKTGHIVAQSEPSKNLRFYQESIELPAPQTVSAVICAYQNQAAFTIGYLD